MLTSNLYFFNGALSAQHKSFSVVGRCPLCYRDHERPAGRHHRDQQETEERAQTVDPKSFRDALKNQP